MADQNTDTQNNQNAQNRNGNKQSGEPNGNAVDIAMSGQGHTDDSGNYPARPGQPNIPTPDHDTRGNPIDRNEPPIWEVTDEDTSLAAGPDSDVRDGEIGDGSNVVTSGTGSSGRGPKGPAVSDTGRNQDS